MKFKTKTIFIYLFSLLWLLSLLIGFSLFSNSQLIKNNDLVYCPLQKTWVKRNEEPQSFRRNPLDQICMSERKKQELELQILLKNAFAVDEQGIFAALQKGAKALENYRESQNPPNQTLVQIRPSFVFLNSRNDWKFTFLTKIEKFSFALNSRPPTFLKSTKFDFKIIQTLDQIPRHINPRSPPFSV